MTPLKPREITRLDIERAVATQLVLHFRANALSLNIIDIDHVCGKVADYLGLHEPKPFETWRRMTNRETRHEYSIGHYWNALDDAADEIDRLRAQLAAAEKYIEKMQACHGLELCDDQITPVQEMEAAGEEWRLLRDTQANEATDVKGE